MLLTSFSPLPRTGMAQWTPTQWNLGFPGSSAGKESPCNAGPQFDPWVGKITWRREQLPTSVFWPGEFHGQRSLAGYSPWGPKKLAQWAPSQWNLEATYPTMGWTAAFVKSRESILWGWGRGGKWGSGKNVTFGVRRTWVPLLGLPLPVCCLSFSFLFHSRGEKSQFTKQQREFREITECFGTWLDPLYLNCVHSRDQIFETPWTVACKLLCPRYFPDRKYCNGLPFPAPEDLPNPGTEPASLVLSALAGGFFTTEPPGKSGYLNLERVEVLVLGCAWERPHMMWGSNVGHHLLNVVGWPPPSSCHLVGSNEQNSFVCRGLTVSHTTRHPVVWAEQSGSSLNLFSYNPSASPVLLPSQGGSWLCFDPMR